METNLAVGQNKKHQTLYFITPEKGSVSLNVEISDGPIEVVLSGVILVPILENPPDNCLIAYDKLLGKPLGIDIILYF
jgi:hypothetical protein